MKKTRKIFVLLIAITLTLGSAVAFALTTDLGLSAAYTFSDPSNNATTLTFKTSQNVSLACNVAASPFATYAAAAQHGSGDKLYGVSSDAVSMFWKTSVLGTSTAAAAVAAIITSTTVSSGAFTGTGWTSL